MPDITLLICFASQSTGMSQWRGRGDTRFTLLFWLLMSIQARLLTGKVCATFWIIW